MERTVVLQLINSIMPLRRETGLLCKMVGKLIIDRDTVAVSVLVDRLSEELDREEQTVLQCE